MTTPTDDQYGVVQLGNPFSMALVCRRCGALVMWSSDGAEGTARWAHDRFHRFSDAVDKVHTAYGLRKTGEEVPGDHPTP